MGIWDRINPLADEPESKDMERPNVAVFNVPEPEPAPELKPGKSHEEKLKLLARKAKGASKKHLSSFIELGGHLADAQSILADVGRAGDFSPWFRSINLSKSTVYRAIDAHKYFGNCPDLGRFSKASIEILCRMPKAREQALSDAADGKTITTKHAKHLVKTLEPKQEKKKSDKPGLITLETDFGTVTIRLKDSGISPATVLTQAMAQLSRRKVA